MTNPARAAAAFAVLCATAVGACAPVISGREPMGLAPALKESASIRLITLSSGWLNVEEDFTDTFAEEVREELSACADGDHPLDLRVHVDDVRRADRLSTALNGEGLHTLAATAELTDPQQDGRVVGRYPIEVGAQAGGALEALVGDRQMMVSEEWARALCAEAFDRNPRRPGPHNATRG